MHPVVQQTHRRSPLPAALVTVTMGRNPAYQRCAIAPLAGRTSCERAGTFGHCTQSQHAFCHHAILQLSAKLHCVVRQGRAGTRQRLPMLIDGRCARRVLQWTMTCRQARSPREPSHRMQQRALQWLPVSSQLNVLRPPQPRVQPRNRSSGCTRQRKRCPRSCSGGAAASLHSAQPLGPLLASRSGSPCNRVQWQGLPAAAATACPRRLSMVSLQTLQVTTPKAAADVLAQHNTICTHKMQQPLTTSTAQDPVVLFNDRR